MMKVIRVSLAWQKARKVEKFRPSVSNEKKAWTNYLFHVEMKRVKIK